MIGHEALSLNELSHEPKRPVPSEGWQSELTEMDPVVLPSEEPMIDRIAAERDALSRELAARVQAGDGLALDVLIELNWGLVKRIAQSFIPMNESAGAISQEDLEQEGLVALMRAAQGYKHGHDSGARFGTYAATCIRNEMVSALKREGKHARVQSLNASELQYHESETGEENEEAFDYPEIHAARGRMVDPAPSPETAALTNESRGELLDLIKGLPQRWRAVLALRYGLIDGYMCSVDEIRALLGVSKARIDQIRHEAFERLRERGGDARLRDILSVF